VASLSVTVAVALWSLGTGAVTISPAAVVQGLFTGPAAVEAGHLSEVQLAVLASIRTPRVVMGLTIGGALAIAGAAMQGMFRNPLADPALIGVSAGASLAVSAAIVLGSAVEWLSASLLRMWVLPMWAFAGSLAATLCVYSLASRRGRTDISVLLLAGIAVNAMAVAGTGLMTFLADDAQLRDITFWSLGSLGGSTWSTVSAAIPALAVSIIGIPFFARHLNAMLLGESSAGHIGISVERTKRLLILLTALAVGTAVSFSGIIGFIGLVAPHLVRLLFGPDHRVLLPLSVPAGGSLLLAADTLSRTVVAPAELPVGIVTAMVGGPFFIWLLVRSRGRGY
jgi:iron complex transport system permease protein